MSPTATGIGLCVAAYFCGSIPFGYIVARLVGGIDIRQHGSGNIGATNVGRVLGNTCGGAVLILDLLKGLLPVGVLLPWLLAPKSADRIHWQVAAGVATILGHMFPCWLGFKGGKGVATSLGVVICLGGWSTPIAATVFAVSFGIWRYASLASILAAVSFAGCQLALLWPAPFSTERWSLATFSLVVPALIIVRHRANIGRLVRGEEQKYQFKKPHGAPADPH